MPVGTGGGVFKMKTLTLIEIAELAKKRFDAQEKQELKQRIKKLGGV